jgi:hypothetical protein
MPGIGGTGTGVTLCGGGGPGVPFTLDREELGVGGFCWAAILARAAASLLASMTPTEPFPTP